MASALEHLSRADSNGDGLGPEAGKRTRALVRLGRVRVLALLLVLLVPAGARADAYAWGGTRGRVSVSVTLSGFSEGAGVGGWTVEGARWLASWAPRVEALLPPGVHARIGNDEADGDLVVRLQGAGPSETIALGIHRAFPGADLDPVIEVLSRRFRTLPPPPSDAPVYTVQLLAASPAHASAFARGLDGRAIEASDDFFWETCLPCSPRVAHVLVGPGPLARVVVGVHADRTSARRSLRRLRALGLRGFVRIIAPSS